MKFSIKHTFAGRVSACIISVITIVFCGIVILFYNISRDRIITSSIRHTNEMITTMATKIDAQLQSVSQTIENSAWIIENNINQPEAIERILKHNLQNNQVIIGSSLAFDPKMIDEEEVLDMRYVSRVNNGIEYEEIDCQNYYYPGMDWYLIPKLLKKSYWSEPYYDTGAGNLIMITYSKPLFNPQGEVYAVYTADISLLNFTDMVAKIQPFPNSYSFMLSRNGYYITHQKKERIMHESIFTIAIENDNPDYERIGRSILAGETGYSTMEQNNETLYAVYTPISNNGWSICNVGKQKDLLSDLNSATNSIIILFIVGLICFFLFSILIIKRLMKPMEGFAASAQEIAHGNFDTPLPDIKSEDEMKKLHDSFAYMQQSLTSYMAELKETTATKERIQSELHIAHEIQMGMIPKIFPPFPERADVDLYAILKPAKEVGGDLYDFFISDEKLYFVVGDVSGKGIPASLFMAVTRSLFRNISGYLSSPHQIITRMNDSISEQNESNMFVTLFVGILDLKSGKLSYCNAGHNPPVLISADGKSSFMEIKKNLPVGLMQDFEYVGEEFTIEKGTKLFCYTDGIVEAEDKDKELYTEERLLQTLTVHSRSGVKRMTESVLESVADHVSTADPSDDLTILVINYK